jgi:hypothetical protein
VLVDAPSSALANLDAPSDTLLSVAQTLANFAPNPAVLDLIGKHAGLSGSQIYAQGPTTLDLPRVIQEPTDLQRNVQVDHETVPYRLQFNQNPNIPVINILAQAPSAAAATTLADATVAGLREYIGQLEAEGKVVTNHRVVLRQLGAATASVDAPSASKTLAILAFMGVFVLWCVLMLAGARGLEIWRRSADLETDGRIVHRRPRRQPAAPGRAAPAHAAAAKGSASPSTSGAALAGLARRGRTATKGRRPATARQTTPVAMSTAREPLAADALIADGRPKPKSR